MQTLGSKSFAGFVVAILATTCLGFAAGGSHGSRERGKNVRFTEMMKLGNGDTLPAGTYWMEVPENSQTPNVTFYKEQDPLIEDEDMASQRWIGKAMATVKATVVPQQKRNENTEVEGVTQGNAELLTAIRPGGWEEKLVFGSAGQRSNAHASE